MVQIEKEKAVGKPATRSSNGKLHPNNRHELNPSLAHVPSEIPQRIATYADAKRVLHVSTTPEHLPCRESEFEVLYGYVELALKENTGSCIYVSGVPGTGKTATCLEVIRTLNELVKVKVHLNNLILCLLVTLMGPMELANNHVLFFNVLCGFDYLF
jgi:hypothetical protein